MSVRVREHSHTTAFAIGKAGVSADMVRLTTLLKIMAGEANMAIEKKPELTAELLKAQIRLGMVARMVKLNIEETPSEEDIPDVMETLLAACGQGEAR
jgi:hypothetical protein